tara:strand:- start:144 stop:2243 length:2100 start_codon:yes stop_codon:yes gene_type:complete
MATNGLNLQTSGLTFATGTVDRMIIDSSGQVGFGTIAPSTDFHVDAAGVRFEGIPSSSSNSNFMVVDGNGVVGTRSDIAVGTVVTDVTEASNVVTVAYNDIADTTFTIDSLTSVAYDTSWGIAQSGTGTVSGNFELPFITAGTYNAGTITLAINGGLESDIEITGIDGTDTFVTSGAINSPASGTLRLTRNDGANIDVTGFQWSTTGDAGTSTMYNGDRLNILGGTGISTIDDGSLTIQINLDDTAVTAASYGDASTVATFTVNQQGQLTAAAEVAIDITASQVSDFNTEVLADVFTAGNFVDSTGAAGIDFTVSAGASVTASLVNSSINTAGTSGTGSVDLGGTITYSSSDSSVVIADNGSGTFDLTVNAASVSDSFVSGGTVSGQNLTLTLTNGKPDVVVSGFRFNLSAQSGVSNLVDMGDTIVLNGGTGISSVGTASDTITFNLDNTAVTAASYGAADTVATFTVDSQGRLTAAADVAIDITASQVSDFDSEVLSSVFEVANFVDSSEIDFTVSAGASVTAGLIVGSIANTKLANDSLTFAGTTGANSEVDLGGTLTFVSTDGSVSISGGGAADTLDISVAGSGLENIYTSNGTLTGTRTVTQSGNVLTFTGGDVQLGGGDFHYDRTNSNVGIGTSTPVVSSVLELSSTTQGFLFPRMTETQRLAIGTPATGLMVYQTDGREGVYIFKSFGWVQVI